MKVGGSMNYEDLVFYAFRYALGRKTYVVGQISSEIINNKDKLSQKVKDLIVAEITEAATKQGLGMDCDIADWLKVKQALQEQV